MEREKLIKLIDKKEFELKKLSSEIYILKVELEKQNNSQTVEMSIDEKLKLYADYFKGRDVVPFIKSTKNSEIYITSSRLKDILLEFITNSNGKTRQEINDYIYPMLNGEIASMNNRVRVSLTYLKKKGFIDNSGSDTKSLWKLK